MSTCSDGIGNDGRGIRASNWLVDSEEGLRDAREAAGKVSASLKVFDAVVHVVEVFRWSTVGFVRTSYLSTTRGCSLGCLSGRQRQGKTSDGYVTSGTDVLPWWGSRDLIDARAAAS